MRLLIVRLSAMGDVVHALPLAKNARAAGATVGWVVERSFAGLLENNPACDRVFPADTMGWRRRPFAAQTRREIGALSIALRRFAPDWTLDAQGLWKSAVIARMARARVVGFSAHARREPASALLCSLRVTPDSTARHVVDRNLVLLAALGISVADRAPDARYLLAAPHAAADAFLAATPRPFAILHAGAGRAEKTWGEERFAGLARGLARERGLHAVLSWGPGDEARVARLEALSPAATRPPLLDLPGLARLVASSALFAGGDTGPLHLADALGVPTLALFGPTDPERNGPYRDRRGIVAPMRNVSDEDVLRLAERVARAAS